MNIKFTPLRRPRRARRGMTLIELMLALGLTAVVLAAIGMAIDLHLRLLDSRRGKVDRIQLARAVLQLIANDLRAAVQQNNADFSAISGMAAEAMAGDALAGLGDAGDLEAMASELGATESDASGSTDIAMASTPPPVPGLYGNQYELQIDVSRLPRVDELQRMISSDPMQNLQDIPSDVKTVAYYFQDATNSVTTATTSFHGGTQPQSGLVRRVMDRAVSQYAADFGNASSLMNVGEVIAPEVLGIEFEYFDGYEWMIEWDSEALGGLPVAVRITMVVAPDELPGSTTMTGQMAAPNYGTTMTTVPGQIYSLVVRLPTAKPCEETDDSMDAGMEAVGL